MVVSDVVKILLKGEGIQAEFKEAKNSLPGNLFETICAFLNRNGGDLVLGVRDDGFPIGVNPDKVVAENPNRPVSIGHITLDNFRPYQKNPVISKFFLQLGRVEEVGTGIRNIYKYLRYYSPGSEPEFLEDDIFRTIIPVTIPKNDTVNRVRDTIRHVYDTVNDTNGTIKDRNDTVKLPEINLTINELFEDEIIEKIKQRLTLEINYILFHGGISLQQIKSITGVETATAKRDMKLLANKNIIKFTGAPKTGKYILTNFGKQLFSYYKSY